jgi:biopolymer transport protein ExbB
MKFTNRILWTFSVCLALWATPLHAETKRREEQKSQEELDKTLKDLQARRQELEDVRIKRWQDKRNSVAAQEAFSDSWNELKADVDRLSQMRNQKQELALRLQSQEAEKRQAVEEQEKRLKQFGLQIQEKLGELEKDAELGFPYRTLERAGQTGAFKKWLDQGDASSAPAIEKLFSLALEDFRTGDSREITRDKLAMRGLAAATGDDKVAGRLNPASQARIVAGYRIRLGQVYQAFVSTESEDVAVLGKTGRVDAKAWDWIEELPGEVRAQIRTSVTALAKGDTTAPALLPMDVLLTKATGDGFTTRSERSFWTAAKEKFEIGGWVMWPILAVAVAGLLIILERSFVYLRRGRSAGRLAAKVQKLVAAGRMAEAEQLCRKAKGSVGKVLLAILENANAGHPREEAESAAHEVLLHEAPALEKRVSTMNILAAAAPLVGLLGTVSGMVRLFEVITVHGTGNPKLMAGGISEALIATQWGLGVAIPLLLAYNGLDTWSSEIISNMEKYSARLVNTLFSKTRRDAAATSEQSVV